MIGLALLLATLATALLVALSLRLSSLLAALIVAYLFTVIDMTACVLVLSPARAVTRPGLAAVQLALFAVATGLWAWRGRPRPDPAPAVAALRRIATDPAALLFGAMVVAVLGYELALGLTEQTNDYDGIAYHLVRAAAWAQHGGYFWIPNSPDDRINEFQPIAEQEILFTFVAFGKGMLFTLPQYLAELGILAAVYGTARRLGYEVRAAFAATALLASFGLVGLEATTAQNDLVAASLPIVAVYLLLGTSRREHALSGFAAGVALGVKLTSGLVLPILLWLAVLRGRRATLAALAGFLVGVLSLGMWGFVLNLAHTGSLLGHGGGRVENQASPSYPASLITALYLLYSMMDLSALTDHQIGELEIAGILVAVCVAGIALARRARLVPAALAGARVVLPFLAPVLVIAGGGLLAWLTRDLGYPARNPGGTVGPLTRTVNSGISAYGPLGAAALIAVCVLTPIGFLRGRAATRELALSLTLPLFLVLLALQSKWNPYLPRFFLVPVAVTAPLLARLLHGRLERGAYLVVAALVAFATLTHDKAKPLTSGYGHPWQLTRVQALALVEHEDAPMLAAYERFVPADTCVGALLGRNEPAYLLYGARLERQVVFLPVTNAAPDENAVTAAYRDGASYVVISANLMTPPPLTPAALVGEFAAAGWRTRTLDGYWTLAVSPHTVPGGCAG